MERVYGQPARKSGQLIAEEGTPNVHLSPSGGGVKQKDSVTRRNQAFVWNSF